MGRRKPRFAGKPPPDSWGMPVRLPCGGWDLWLAPEANDAGWRHVKVTRAAGKRERKANFYMAWSERECRLARSRQAGMLKKFQPAVYDAVVVALALEVQ